MKSLCMDIKNCHNLLASSFKKIYYSIFMCLLHQDKFRILNDSGALPVSATVFERLTPDQV
jgi:hypothetical protein